MGKHTTANLRDRGKELTVRQHETDSPVIPIAQIEQLHRLRPDLVDRVFTQTQEKAEYRRSEVKRVNKFTFIEHIIGQVFALLTGLAAVFLTGRSSKP